jgi:hypothetical protein
VSLQAAATDAALNTVMQVGGGVRARSIEQRDGQIVLSGGSSGVVLVDATLDASGGTGVRGGTVSVLGERVALLDAARVDASGGSGGGQVLVGGNYQGHGPESNAKASYVAGQASIDASARDSGDGGRVIIWSDDATTFKGSITARGGAAGGNGGFAEVSGKQHLGFDGSVDLSATGGAKGRLLLDPNTLIVGTVADVNGDTTQGDDLPATGTVLAGDFPLANAPSQVTATRVASLLATTDVTLQATGSLTVSAPVTVAAGGAATTLSLQGNFVTISAPLTLNNSSLNAASGTFSDSIRIDAPVSSLNSVTLTSISTSINSSINAGQVLLASPLNRSGANVSEGTGGAIVTPSLTTQITGDSSLSVTLTNPGNRVGTLTLGASDANIRIDNPAGTPVTVQGGVAGNFALDASGGIAQSALATGGLNVSGATTLTSRGSDAIALTNPSNVFTGGVSFAAGADLSLAAAQGNLTAAGTAAGNVVVTVAGGSLTLGSPGITTSGALIDLTSVGFINGSATASFALATGAGGRFFIRSSDFSQDQLRSITLGTGANQVNQEVLSSWTGAAPASGNVYFTNAVGTITTPAADVAAVSKVYDGTTAFAYTQTGTAANGQITTAPGQTIPLVGYTLTSSGTFTDSKNVGTDKPYTVAATSNVVGTDANGASYYGFAFGGFSRPAGPSTAISAITPRPLTSTGITGIGRVYDGTTAVGVNTSGALLNNTVAGDAVALVLGGATGTMANKSAGAAKAVTVTGISLTGADAANYSVSDASNATADIAARPINATGLTAIDRVYDGTTAVALNASATTLTGVLSGDTVTAIGGTGTMADKNVGTAKPVTLSAVTLGGADAGNYIATGVGTSSVNIAVRPVTSTGVTGVDRVYDGTSVVAVTAAGATLNNAISGDAVGISTGSATGTMADKNVGSNKPVTLAGVTLSGADAANYSLTEASTATVNISALSLQPAGIRAVNRIVDGTTVVALDTRGAKVNGVLPGDVVLLDASGAVGSVATPDPAVAKPVTVSGLLLTGADAGNYALLATPIGSNGGGLTVRILTVPQQAFEDVRFKQYLQGVSDAQEPFRRAMAEALAAGFGKENIRKQLSRGLVFETGLAAPAVDNIDTAARPAGCTAAGGTSLGCGR